MDWYKLNKEKESYHRMTGRVIDLMNEGEITPREAEELIKINAHNIDRILKQMETAENKPSKHPDH